MVHNYGFRQTIDLQHLNRQCKRETHHCPSPFQLACQVPPVSTDCLWRLYDTDIEASFFRAWDYLALCWEKVSIFQFCLDDVKFAGLRITYPGISPSVSPPLLYQGSSPISGTFRCQTISLMPGKPSDMGLFYQLDHATISIIGQTKHQILLEWDTGSALPRLQENTHISSGR